MTFKKILNAMQIIEDYCKKHVGKCEGCMFDDDDNMCFLATTPSQWETKKKIDKWYESLNCKTCYDLGFMDMGNTSAPCPDCKGKGSANFNINQQMQVGSPVSQALPNGAGAPLQPA